MVGGGNRREAGDGVVLWGNNTGDKAGTTTQRTTTVYKEPMRVTMIKESGIISGTKRSNLLDSTPCHLGIGYCLLPNQVFSVEQRLSLASGVGHCSWRWHSSS